MTNLTLREPLHISEGYIELSGFNVDATLLNQLKNQNSKLINIIKNHERNGKPILATDLNGINMEIPLEALSPEVLSATGARISRDPAEIPTIRAGARDDIAKTRKSNENIVFGLGHSSVAEHAFFNFDIVGISRLALEYIEDNRLASYTEKSQRYIKIDGNPVVPPELKNLNAIPTTLLNKHPKLLQTFIETNLMLAESYKDARKALSDFYISKGIERKIAIGKAMEDARYFLALPTTGQVEFSTNGRSLEHAIRKMISAPIPEVQEIGYALHKLGKKIAPSLLQEKYFENRKFYTETPKELTEFILDMKKKHSFKESRPNGRGVLLFDIPNPEITVESSIIFNASRMSFEDSLKLRSLMTQNDRTTLYQIVHKNRETFHPVPRAFEFTGQIAEYTLSSTAFAQLKRHRMAGLIRQDYLGALGVTVPDSFKEFGNGLPEKLEDVCKNIAQLYEAVYKDKPTAAPYFVPNAQNRRALVLMNPRELYAFANLRLDGHAQLDIRQLAERHLNAAKKKFPMLYSMAVGKDNFEEAKKDFLS